VALSELEACQERFAGNQVIENLPLAPELTVNPRVPDAFTPRWFGAALDNVAEDGQLIERLLDRHSKPTIVAVFLGPCGQFVTATGRFLIKLTMGMEASFGIIAPGN
jgi:hypothetical protein